VAIIIVAARLVVDGRVQRVPLQLRHRVKVNLALLVQREQIASPHADRRRRRSVPCHQLTVDRRLVEVAEDVVALLAESHLVDGVANEAEAEHVAGVFARVPPVRKTLHMIKQPIDDVRADERVRYGDLEPVAVAHVQPRVRRCHRSDQRLHVSLNGQIQVLVAEPRRIPASCCLRHAAKVVLVVVVVIGHVISVCGRKCGVRNGRGQ